MKSKFSLFVLMCAFSIGSLQCGDYKSSKERRLGIKLMEKELGVAGPVEEGLVNVMKEMKELFALQQKLNNGMANRILEMSQWRCSFDGQAETTFCKDFWRRNPNLRGEKVEEDTNER